MDAYERERQDLVTTLRAAGPDAPTLCAGWRTRHLAAHLLLRLHHPVQLAAAVLPGSADADTRTSDLAATATEPEQYQRLLDRFAAPAAPLNPMGWGGNRLHLVEYVVHHEDVRRATGQPANRDLPQPMQEELWRQLRTFARLTQARAETGVVLVVPGGPRAVVRRGRRSIAVSGMPVELALYLTGRTAHADVQVIATKPRPRALHRR